MNDGASTGVPIPNVVHLIFGLAADFGSKPFSLVHFLAVESILQVNRPDEVMFYYEYEPAGEWWDRCKHRMTLVRIRAPRSVGGRQLANPAHRADVVRLDVLRRYGGIYVDLDVLCIRPWDGLRRFPCVLGEEATRRAKVSGRTVVLVEGLCNAVIMAEAGSEFIVRWLEGFDPATSLWSGMRSIGHDPYWGEYSVKYPHMLSRLLPDAIHVESYQTFHWPSWTEEGVTMLFDSAGASFDAALCHHLWESVTWDKYLNQLTLEEVMSRTGYFYRLARTIIENAT